jgi:ribosome-binding protein aMBF1 (putative translation factor)
VKEIEFASAAVRQWRKLTAATRAQIDHKLKAYAETGVGDVKALKGALGMRLARRVHDKGQHHHGSRGGTSSRDLCARFMTERIDRESFMAKSGIAKSSVQFIRAPDGSDLAVLPRNEYDRLVALAAEAQEDAGASRIVRNSTRALKEGREVALPKAVVDRLANGENAVRVIREWRDMIQGELAVAVGISQNYLSGIETGRRKGPAELQKKFARALGVPLDLLVD